MKKSRLFMAVGAFTLAVSATFATKAHKKFKTLTTVWAQIDGIFWERINIGSNLFTTKATTKGQARLELQTASGTSTGTIIRLFTFPYGVLPAYLR